MPGKETAVKNGDELEQHVVDLAKRLRLQTRTPCCAESGSVQIAVISSSCLPRRTSYETPTRLIWHPMAAKGTSLNLPLLLQFLAAWIPE